MFKNYFAILKKYSAIIDNEVMKSQSFEKASLYILWQKGAEILQQLAEELNIYNICVFIYNKFEYGSVNQEITSVLNVGLNKEILNKLTINFSQLPNDIIKYQKSSKIDHQIIQLALSKNILDDRWKVLFISKQTIGPTIAILNIQKRHTNIRFVTEALVKYLCIRINSYMTHIYDHLEKENLKNSYRILGHENGQIIAGIDSLREYYLGNPTRLRMLDTSKFDNINNDLKGLLEQMYFISKSSRYIVNEIPQPNIEAFFLYRDLLYKWVATFSLETIKRRVLISITSPTRNDPIRPQIYADKALLEQAIYNLISNAVKYCYRGTRIFIDAKKQSSDVSSPYVISIINYGPSTSTGRQIYEMYYRGENTKSREGMGIGLYIAQKIAKSHGGTISHKCTEISDFNLPLLKYIYDNYSAQDLNDLKVSLPPNDQALKTLFKEIVAVNRDNKMIYLPSELEVKNSIEKPTYKVLFEVIIPSQGV